MVAFSLLAQLEDVASFSGTPELKVKVRVQRASDEINKVVGDKIKPEVLVEETF